MTLRGDVLGETTPSSMAASRFKYNTKQLRYREFFLALWLWYWLFNQAALVQILSEPYISAMHLFISFFLTEFVHRTIMFSKGFFWGGVIRSQDCLVKVTIIPIPHNLTLDDLEEKGF